MPERRKRLTEKLNELDEHIASGEPLDPAVDEPLQQAIGNVRQHIDAAPPAEEDDSSLADDLGDIALKLEVSHPKLTEILNRISELLAGAGI